VDLKLSVKGKEFDLKASDYKLNAKSYEDRVIIDFSFISTYKPFHKRLVMGEKIFIYIKELDLTLENATFLGKESPDEKEEQYGWRLSFQTICLKD